MKQKLLNLDGKKRITLGKLIPKSTTALAVKINKDGSILLTPQSNLTSDETWIYDNKKYIKILAKSLIDLKKNVTTKINSQFWDENFEKLDILTYTNQFLKNIEPIVAKNNFKKMFEIKDILCEIVTNQEKNCIALKNTKTKTNNTIFMFKNNKLNIFWTYDNKNIVILALIDRK